MFKTLITTTMVGMLLASPGLQNLAKAQGFSPAETAISDTGHLAVNVQPIAKFKLPYAVAVLPTGELLVPEVYGGLRVFHQNGGVAPKEVSGFPSSFIATHDVILSPDYNNDHRIYVSYGERGKGDPTIKGADVELGPGYNLAVISGVLTLDADGGHLDDANVIWRQSQRVPNQGQFGGRMAFSPDHRYLFITSGDRETFTAAQDMTTNLGKTVRIFPDGSIPADNPFANRPGVPGDIWSLGHRNAYGIAFDREGKQWQHEMGPKGGDEINVIEPGANYGWPIVSWGDHYDDGHIQKPTPGDGFVMPALQWTPVTAPAGMIIYSGKMFKELADRAIIGGLRSEGLVIVKLDGETAVEEDRISLNARIRDVREGLDGAIWVLEDSPTGRLLKLTPRAVVPPTALLNGQD